MNPLENFTIVLPAGGKGERMAALAATRKANKAAIKIKGKSMIERTLEMYARAGARRFVALVFHKAESIIRTLGDGKRFGVRISYAVDPREPVGKGGAIRLALDKGIIPESLPMIVHNPDDQVVRIDARFPALILARHRAAVKRGALATAVCVPETEYAYSAFNVRKGMAVSARMYPLVRMPTHIGVTIFEAAAAGIFRKLIPLSRKVDFESVVLPHLAKRGRLGVAMIPSDCWIPVNDLKNYNKLRKYLDVL